MDEALEERRKIVAWLREQVRARNLRDILPFAGASYADAIERGDHDYPTIRRERLGPVGKEVG